jgi:hypothetical protein
VRLEGVHVSQGIARFRPWTFIPGFAFLLDHHSPPFCPSVLEPNLKQKKKTSLPE